MQKDWNYIAIVLDEKNRNLLEHSMASFIHEDWTICCHHVTLIYNDSSERAEHYRRMLKPLIGSHTPVFCRTIAFSDNIAATGIYLNRNIPCANEKPHITLGYRKPASPKDSNSLTTWLPLEDGPGVLHGTITII